MKNLKKILIVVMFIMSIFVFNNNTYALESTQDGLTVTLTTDKANYETGEDICIDLIVENNNKYAVALTEIENIIPNGHSLAKNTENKLRDKELNVGETIHLKTTINKKEVEIENTNNNSNNIKNETTVKGNVSTNDNSDIELYLLIVTLGGVGICLLVGIKKKRVKNTMIVFIVLGLLSGLVVSEANAEEQLRNIRVEKNVEYGGKTLKLNASVSYKIGGSNPQEPVTYQDGVSQVYLDFTIDEDKKELTVLDSELTSSWKSGDIYILKNKQDSENGIVVKVVSVIENGDGSSLVKYDVPDLSKVVKDIDYSGQESQTGVMNPADGVTLTENTGATSSKNRSAIRTESSKNSRKESFDLFTKYKYIYEKNGVKVTGELNIERINYDFDIETNLFQLDINKIYMTIDSEITLGLEAKSDFGGEKKIKLASYEAYLGYGFSAGGDLYANISIDGEITLENTIEVSCGFDYSNNKFKGICEIDSKLTKAKANANLSIGASAEPNVSFLNIGLVGAEFEYGRVFDLELDDISLNPIQYCLEVGHHNYATISSSFLPGTWNKKFTVVIQDKNSDANKKYLHLEEKGIVNECSRKYGSLKGTVLKQDGNENIPLLYASVTLEKNGKVLHEIKTGSNGIFKFGQEIEKGNYDIYVRSNQYETYKGTVKIEGNKENIINDPIVLKAYAKSVIVTGKIYEQNTNQPISEAMVSVEGYDDRKVTTDMDGMYTLEVPIGNQKIVATAKNYSSNSYISEFKNDINNIDIGLIREYKADVKQINAGESYQFDFSSNKRIYVRSNGPTEYSSYLDKDATYHRKNFDGEFYRGVKSGSHWEIKVFSGSLTVFANDGDFYGEPDSNLSDHCTYSSMNGIDPFKIYHLTPGTSKTFDNQIDKPKDTSYRIYCISEDEISGSEEVTDYYYNTHFGWDITQNTYKIDGIQNYWRPISNLSKCNIRILSGNLIVYHYRLDPITVY